MLSKGKVSILRDIVMASGSITILLNEDILFSVDNNFFTIFNICNSTPVIAVYR